MLSLSHLTQIIIVCIQLCPGRCTYSKTCKLHRPHDTSRAHAVQVPLITTPFHCTRSKEPQQWQNGRLAASSHSHHPPSIGWERLV